MTSQREWEHRIWGNLAATMDAGSYEDTIPELTDQALARMSDAERRRLGAAWDKVQKQLYRHARPRTKRSAP